MSTFYIKLPDFSKTKFDNIEEIINHVKSSLDIAEGDKTVLSRDVLLMEGMTGLRTRMFYNAICAPYGGGVRYLEVGTWKGSSFISAMYGNKGYMSCTPVVIDNWSEFTGPRDEFVNNVNTLLGLDFEYRLIDKDCFSVDEEIVVEGGYNIYLYDGAHDIESHRKAIVNMWKYLADVSIIIIDDWNWSDVRDGTMIGLAEVGANILFKHCIQITDNNEHTPHEEACEGYWNGMAVFVVQKTT